jgi:beta-galactosidase GanA
LPRRDRFHLPLFVVYHYIFVLNYISAAIEINVKQPMIDLLTGKRLSGITKLDKFGVMVLEIL